MEIKRCEIRTISRMRIDRMSGRFRVLCCKKDRMTTFLICFGWLYLLYLSDNSINIRRFVVSWPVLISINVKNATYIPNGMKFFYVEKVFLNGTIFFWFPAKIIVTRSIGRNNRLYVKKALTISSYWAEQL